MTGSLLSINEIEAISSDGVNRHFDVKASRATLPSKLLACNKKKVLIFSINHLCRTSDCQIKFRRLLKCWHLKNSNYVLGKIFLVHKFNSLQFAKKSVYELIPWKICKRIKYVQLNYKTLSTLWAINSRKIPPRYFLQRRRVFVCEKMETFLFTKKPSDTEESDSISKTVNAQ